MFPTTQSLHSQFEAWKTNTPPVTRFIVLFSLATLVLDLIWDGTISAAFALPPFPSSMLAWGDAYRLVTSFLTPVQGIFAVLYSLYVGNDLLGKFEKYWVSTVASPGSIERWGNGIVFFALSAVACTVNIATLIAKYFWFTFAFPRSNYASRRGVVGGLDSASNFDGWTGGLFPVLVFIATFLAFRPPRNDDALDTHEDVPFFPFSVKRRYEGLMLAFLFLLVGGGDLDLFVAWFIARGFSHVEGRREEEARRRLRTATLEATERRLGGGGISSSSAAVHASTSSSTTAIESS